MLSIDHVQLAMPPGHESRARAFYAGVLGMREVPKPVPLAASGGVWFVLGEVQLHLGVEADFRPSRKAHPAIRVADLVALSSLCASAGFPPEFDTRYPGRDRFFVSDPFGNRIEFVQWPPRADEETEAS